MAPLSGAASAPTATIESMTGPAPAPAPQSLRVRARPWIAYALAWVPFAVLQFVSVAMSSDETTGMVIDVAISRTVISALLGVGVWWFSGRIAFPLQGRARFYALQSLLALGFAALWTVAWYARWIPQMGWTETMRATGGASALGRQMMTGVWLYLMIAGVSYTLRVHRRLREREVAAARAETLAARAQLAALRAQLNPHFLFNSLHSLSTLVRHDPVAAELALDRLGDLLRYALDGTESDDVLLAHEWEFTRNYIELEQLRMGERLRVRASLEDDALECEVPSFVLQPLVENAIRHGIAPRPEGGTLSVTARLHDGALVLEVEDDGPGATAERVGNRAGLGLRALRQRLEARYEGRASVAVVTEPGSGFAVTVRVPVDSGAPSPVHAA